LKETVKKEKKPMSFERTAGFYIDKKKPVYLLCVLLTIAALFFAWNVQVTDSVVAYLPSSTNSGAGYAVMTEEFTDLATAQVLLDNVSEKQCELVREQLLDIDGVYAVDFDSKSYADGTGVLDVTFEYGESEEAQAAYDAVKAAVSNFDGGITSSLDSGWWWNIDFGMIFLMVAGAALLIVALIYASRTYADVWVMLFTMIVAVILNYGTSLGMSKITSLTSGIFQAAFTMYYAALICRRYTKERKEQDVRPAVITAVAGSMPKLTAAVVIAATALLILACAKLRLGLDFALALTKGIVISIILCFTLLPGLITIFAKRMDDSRHKPLLPRIRRESGKVTYKTRYAFPIIFLLLAIAALTFIIVYPVQPYSFDGEGLPLIKSPGQVIEYRADRDFDKDTSEVYMIVPGGNYEAEEATVYEVGNMVEVVSVKALSNSSAASYILTDSVNIWQFADITGLNTDAVWNIFSDHSELVGVEAAGGVGEYEVPFIEIFTYTYNRVQEGSLTVKSDVAETLDSIRYELSGADLELCGENHDRIVIEVSVPDDSQKAAQLMENIRAVGEAHYGETVYVTGEAGAASDLEDAWVRDMILITALTVVLLSVLLAVLLKASGLAIVLVILVQGGVWLTMAVPYLFPGFFSHVAIMVGYTIQMIAGVTFTAAVANSYKKFKQTEPLKKAIGKALKENYSLIVVTGCLLILSGVVLGVLSFDADGMAIGFIAAIGGVINMLIALCVAPQTMLALDIIDSKITKSDVDITGEVKAPVEERMDIVEAIEKLKAAEQPPEESIDFEGFAEEPDVSEEAVSEETIVFDIFGEIAEQPDEANFREKEGEQSDETEK